MLKKNNPLFINIYIFFIILGMTIAVVRGQASMDTIEKTWEAMRIDVPRAPGLGLVLDEIHYDRYNRRFANDGIHESLTWENVEEDVEAFKQDFIFPEMISGEKEEKSMFEWLKVLPIHSFAQRHFENSGDLRTPLEKANKYVINANGENENVENENATDDNL